MDSKGPVILFYLIAAGFSSSMVEGVSDVNSKANEDLFEAVEYNDATQARYAIENDADIKARNNDGFTPLQMAAAKGYLETMVVMLKMKPDEVTVNNILRNRLLHLAVTNGTARGVAFLLAAGADINAPGQGGLTPVKRAAGHNSTLALLQALQSLQVRRDVSKSEAVWLPLMRAAYANDPQAVREAIGNGADIEFRDEVGYTAVHMAAADDSVEAMCVLLRAGANKEAQSNEHHRPLHVAAWRGRDEAVALLTIAGADIHSRGWQGKTPLQMAVHYNRTSTVALLQALGG